MQLPTLGYILHTRPYKEAHLIVDAFTRDHGRVSLMARQAKTQHPKSRIWQAFILLELSWRGQGDLPSVTEAEALDYSIQLTGVPLFCGVYLNELLQKLLHKGECCSSLWQLYQQSLQQLSIPNLLELSLRRFELGLLQELGMGIDFFHDSTGHALITEQRYHYQPGHGWIGNSVDSHAIRGAMIQQMAAVFVETKNDALRFDKTYVTDPVLGLATKRLTRQVLAHALGSQTLQSRQLFAAMV